MRTAHLADGCNANVTACGEPFEEWQLAMPTDEEIAFADLDPDVRQLVRDADQARRGGPSEPVRQCQACLKVAWRGTSFV